MEENKNFVIEFDYNTEALNTLKNELSSIDKNDITQVESAVKQLVKVRGIIQKKGKAYRDDANAFNKRVLEKEKEYVEIIEPLEVEYKELIKQDEQRKILEARKELLPSKKKQLSVLKIQQPTDEEILAMSDEQWISFYNLKFSEHEETIKAEERKEQDEKDRKEREEQIKKETEERIKKEEKEKQEAKERLETEEKEKIETDKKYQDWLVTNGYSEETKSDFVIEKIGNKVRLSKIIAIYSFEDNA